MSAQHSEIVSFPARHFAGLPVETRLYLKHPDFAEEIIFSSAEIPVPESLTGLLFDGPEVGALAAGVDADRTWSSDFRAWLEHKRDDPQHRLTSAEALAGAVPARVPAATLGELLARLGLELVGVELVEGGRAPAGIRHAA